MKILIQVLLLTFGAVMSQRPQPRPRFQRPHSRTNTCSSKIFDRKIQLSFLLKFNLFKPICHISWAIAKLLEGTQPHHQFLGKFLFKNMDFISVVAPFWTHVQFLQQDIALKMEKPKVQELLLGLDIILENR